MSLPLIKLTITYWVTSTNEILWTVSIGTTISIDCIVDIYLFTVLHTFIKTIYMTILINSAEYKQD